MQEEKSKLNKYEMQQNKMWKKRVKENKRNERIKKRMNAKGGAAGIKGGAENKRGKRRTGGACWAYGLGFGPVRPMNPGSGQERYIRVARPISSHFFFSFSLFSF